MQEEKNKEILLKDIENQIPYSKPFGVYDQLKKRIFRFILGVILLGVIIESITLLVVYFKDKK
ncbi:hypothetical protein DDB_G0287865 [Dictyostelium discoideum AX4]|uniref:Putative uncharacterized transmembrane protein DDB_G0287865 n=1 Tax=Dictyostelium discoideum TaxID=44689 RepID=Y5934_DICDI|nr:hypothetical protein DDB_G0287865 [Dictyostelium discoideum AX4]Q54JQ0.1 RecName: Full=Putative uncharacterized transmembrane protein DDB_G0287865 [Dictyostelium discoideum]EAL63579.1 hypothetical protein DDB_G0287865 [Dictyostelium discoideum AX4]|eukprot:XP_637102.1 hypothetical protein DDB_G0287865 [Dictyostelium discoideum AX4]